MKTITTTISAALLVLGSSLGRQAHAEDIDLFMGPPPSTTVAKANVLFIVDNAGANNGNMANPCGGTNKKLSSEMCVLGQVLSTDPNALNLNIGLETFNPSGVGKGGYIRYHVRDMGVAANRAALIASATSIPETNNAPFAKSFHEAYKYYRGAVPYVGTQSSAYDPAAYNGSTYNSPAIDACQRNYIIFLGNGGPDSSENTDAQALLTGVGGSTSVVSLNPNNFQSNWSDEYTRFLYGADVSTLDGTQNIVTYSIAINTGSGPENTTPAKAGRKLIESMAVQGQGKYYEVSDAAELADALSNILLKIQAVNSVFAAVTLPVSVNVRGTYLNQVYMGVFRPDASALPRWVGNLKEYQLTIGGTGDLQLSDKNGDLVTNAATGFVNPDVTSYWTQPSSYWTFKPTPVQGVSDAPDGDLVERGATAQKLRTDFATSQAARKVYTCTGTCGSGSLLSATPFDTANSAITIANTGTADATERDLLINWVRGQDNNGVEDSTPENENGNLDGGGNAITTDVRASIHGDVLHSRPAVVNYNRYGDNDDVMVFYGGNDGLFHAIQGGQLTSGARAGGTELWSFAAPEHFGQLKRMRDNDVTMVAQKRPSFFDGPVSVWQVDGNNDGILDNTTNDEVKLYTGMRRGGRFLYAFNVLNPANPTFLWKKTNASTGYGELGQTWSTPKPVKIRAFANPVLIMGAGYDPVAEDAMPQGTATMGRGVMVIDAITGAMLVQFGPAPSGAATNRTVSDMTYSIPADVMVLDRDVDGFKDRVYAADTGGNVWRLDIDSANPASWTATKLAALGGSGANARKFLYAPDVLYGEPDGTQPFDAIMIGSGDREHPFDLTVTNRFYMLKDTNMGKVVDPGFTTITEADLYDTTSNVIQEGATTTDINAAQAALDGARGWFITLLPGEKVVGGAVTLNGTTFFGTNEPSTGSTTACTNLGTARLYALNFLNGSATMDNCSNGTDADGNGVLAACDRSQTLQGGGFPPSPTPVVTIIDGVPKEAVVSGTHVQEPPESYLGMRRRVYWHHNVDK